MRAARVVAVAVVVPCSLSRRRAAAGPAQDSGRGSRGRSSTSPSPGSPAPSDGVLHVVYTRKNGTKEDLVHLEVSPAGKVGADCGRARRLVVDVAIRTSCACRTDRCASFFGGIRSTNPGETNNAMNTATAPGVGRAVDAQAREGGAGHVRVRDGVAGAGLAKDGTPISTWSGSPGLGFHYGVDPSTPDGKIPQTGCCLYTPEIARRLGERPGVGRIPLERERGARALRERDRARRTAGRPAGSRRDP